MNRIGRPLGFGIFAVYSGGNLVEVVSANSHEEVKEWARLNIGPNSYVTGSISALDISK